MMVQYKVRYRQHCLLNSLDSPVHIIKINDVNIIAACSIMMVQYKVRYRQHCLLNSLDSPVHIIRINDVNIIAARSIVLIVRYILLKSMI